MAISEFLKSTTLRCLHNFTYIFRSNNLSGWKFCHPKVWHALNLKRTVFEDIFGNCFWSSFASTSIWLWILPISYIYFVWIRCWVVILGNCKTKFILFPFHLFSVIFGVSGVFLPLNETTVIETVHKKTLRQLLRLVTVALSGLFTGRLETFIYITSGFTVLYTVVFKNWKFRQIEKTARMVPDPLSSHPSVPKHSRCIIQCNIRNFPTIHKVVDNIINVLLDLIMPFARTNL